MSLLYAIVAVLTFIVVFTGILYGLCKDQGKVTLEDVFLTFIISAGIGVLWAPALLAIMFLAIIAILFYIDSRTIRVVEKLRKIAKKEVIRCKPN
jgi:hypothetical protein